MKILRFCWTTFGNKITCWKKWLSRLNVNTNSCFVLGHGPFSHMYDGRVIPKARPGFEWKVSFKVIEAYHLSH